MTFGENPMCSIRLLQILLISCCINIFISSGLSHERWGPAERLRKSLIHAISALRRVNDRPGCVIAPLNKSNTSILSDPTLSCWPRNIFCSSFKFEFKSIICHKVIVTGDGVLSRCSHEPSPHSWYWPNTGSRHIPITEDLSLQD